VRRTTPQQPWKEIGIALGEIPGSVVQPHSDRAAPQSGCNHQVEIAGPIDILRPQHQAEVLSNFDIEARIGIARRQTQVDAINPAGLQRLRNGQIRLLVSVKVRNRPVGMQGTESRDWPVLRRKRRGEKQRRKAEEGESEEGTTGRGRDYAAQMVGRNHGYSTGLSVTSTGISAEFRPSH